MSVPSDVIADKDAALWFSKVFFQGHAGEIFIDNFTLFINRVQLRILNVIYACN